MIQHVAALLILLRCGSLPAREVGSCYTTIGLGLWV